MRLLFFILFLLLQGCGSVYVEQSYSPLILSEQAYSELSRGNQNKAISLFRTLEKNYIFDKKAIEAEILLIWLYYKNNNLDEAEVIASSFLKYFPYNEYTPWVEYMYALIIFQEIPYKKRNITKAYEALGLFREYINKYPGTIYSKDLLFKMPLIKNVLANRVMDIGNYYLKHKVYIGAIKRFKEIVEFYNDSVFVPEALYRLIYSCLTIGLSTEALEYFKLIELNYKDSIWFNKSKNLIDNNL